MIRDKYRIDAFIATGSMANVYAATHRNGSRVALKILHRELARDPSLAERFKREGYFANAIGHPGIVRAIDDDMTEDGCAFIVMELLEGETLEDRRTRMGGRIPLTEVLQIGDAMLEVLSAAHDHEVLHRDLKPENVFITKKNEVKLLDFGVARFNDGRSSSDMTGVGMVLGTPAFMPPEQALGRREEVDARSDIWGVGATLFTVIAGESVHVGGDAKTKLIATARTPARSLTKVAPDVPRAVASVIDRALAFDKHERWADANAMREALRWARMSLDGDIKPTLERLGDSIPPPVPTRRTPDDEPTLAGRIVPGFMQGLEAPFARGADSFEDSTAKRQRLEPGRMAPNIHRHPKSENVVTSAPPVTQRDLPPSMAMSEGPTFSLRNDPIFSLRKNAPEPAPVTERMPHVHGDLTPNTSGLSDAPQPKSADMNDAAAIFRAALANTALSDDPKDRPTEARFDPIIAEMQRTAPRPAAGAPADVAPPPFPTSPSMRTAPGIGAPPPALGSSPYATPSAPPVFHPETAPSYPAPAVTHTSAPPSGPTVRRSGRPSITPEDPGPLLSTIAPKKRSGAFRVLVPILIGVIAGVATYVVVVRQRAANASHAGPPAAVTTAPLASVMASSSASTSASPVPTEPAIPSALPSTVPVASSVAAAPTTPPKKKRPRTKPPSAPATAATTTATAEPTAEPAPAPAPTPTDTLPKKDPE